jgi:hypothetical protein
MCSDIGWTRGGHQTLYCTKVQCGFAGENRNRPVQWQPAVLRLRQKERRDQRGAPPRVTLTVPIVSASFDIFADIKVAGNGLGLARARAKLETLSAIDRFLFPFKAAGSHELAWNFLVSNDRLTSHCITVADRTVRFTPIVLLNLPSFRS